MSSSSASSYQNLESTRKPKLRNSFNLLKTHACEVANFTLQWQDLEDHFRFIHSEIDSKLQQIYSVKTIQNETNSPSKDLFLPRSKNPESKTSEISVKNGKELILYVKEHLKDHKMLQDYLFKLFKAVDEPGKLVIEAVKDFNSLGDTGRWSCKLVLKEFGRLREEEDVDVAEEVREEAKRLAFKWKKKLRMKNSLGILLFLLLLVDFGLVGEFGFDEILKLFDRALGRTPELFRALGFADEAPDYIQNLISQNKRLEAVRFVYAFELVDQFPIVPLLKDHAEYAKKVAEEICEKGKNSFKALSDATDTEIAALRSIIRSIKKYNLDSEYSSEMLRKQILQMKKQRKDMKANTETTSFNYQSQQNNGNKRSASPLEAEWNQQRRVGHKKRADLNASVNISTSMNTRQPSIHRPTTSFAGQGTQNSTPSPRTNSSWRAVPNTYVGASFNAHRQHSPNQAGQLLSDLSTAHHLTSSFGNNPCASSTPVTSCTIALARPFEFVVSATICPHATSSPGLYERRITTNGSSGQFGLSGSATIHQNTSYSPGLYERSITTYGRSGRFESAGSATMHQHTSYSSGPYDRVVPTNGSFFSSGQFGLASTHTAVAGASNASTNVFSSYHRDLLRTSSYNRQASSSNTGIASSITSFNRSGYNDRPVLNGGNYGVSSKFPPYIYHP